MRFGRELVGPHVAEEDDANLRSHAFGRDAEDLFHQRLEVAFCADGLRQVEEDSQVGRHLLAGSRGANFAQLLAVQVQLDGGLVRARFLLFGLLFGLLLLLLPIVEFHVREGFLRVLVLGCLGLIVFEDDHGTANPDLVPYAKEFLFDLLFVDKSAVAAAQVSHETHLTDPEHFRVVAARRVVVELDGARRFSAEPDRVLANVSYLVPVRSGLDTKVGHVASVLMKASQAPS